MISRVGYWPESIPDNILELRSEFERYITENRLDSVISKEGEITGMEEMGKYIKFVLKDAMDDFLKENDISDIDKADSSLIFKTGGKIVANFIMKRFENG